MRHAADWMLGAALGASVTTWAIRSVLRRRGLL